MSRHLPISDNVVPLLNGACDGTLIETQIQELAALLSSDSGVRKIYVDHVQLRRRIRNLCRVERACDGGLARVWATLPQAMPSSSPALPPSFLFSTFHGTIGYSSGWPVSYLIATVMTGLLILSLWLMPISRPEQVATHSVPAAVVVEPKMAYVGRITGMVDCKWAEKVAGGGWRVAGAENPPSTIHHPTSLVSLGDKFDLASGLMEITYDTGAKVILQGSVTYQVDSNGGYLALGKLTGKLEKKVASGQWSVASKSEIPSPQPLAPSPFVVRTPTATVTDLGTEFGVDVNEQGVTETDVFVGAVKVSRSGGRDFADEHTTVIHAGQFARIAADEGAAVSVGQRRPDAMAKCFVRAIPARPREVSADDYAKLVLSMQPLAYYRMEKPAACERDPNSKEAMVIFDSAPGGHHGTLHMSTEYGSGAWADGRFGSGLYLGGPGFGDYATVRHWPMAVGTPLSVAAWVSASGLPEWATIVANWCGSIRGQFQFGLHGSDGDLAAYVVQNDGKYVFVREGASRPFPLGTWQHVAFVFDGSRLRLYRNATEVASAPAGSLLAGLKESSLVFGCKADGRPAVPEEHRFFWQGRLDEVAVFPSALSDADIKRLALKSPP